ncbi:MAG: hypothetical protein AAFR26_15350 [Cyanobacteria bacterium J06626_4]
MPFVRVRDHPIVLDRAEAIVEPEHAGMVRADLTSNLDFLSTQHRQAPPLRGALMLETV